MTAILSRRLLPKKEFFVPPVYLFQYQDPNTGKLFLPDFDPKPQTSMLTDSHDEILQEFIDENIEAARNGDVTCAVDLMLTMSHYLTNEIPIPGSLAAYVADILQNATVSFGHTPGGSDKRNSAVAKALGLVIPKHAAKKSEREDKQSLVYSYVWWRMKLFEETLYAAAKHAEKAFKGTKRLSHDACEKIYEKKVDNSRDVAPLLGGLVVLKLEPSAFKNMVFNDDDFLRAIIPHIKDTHSNKAEFVNKLCQ